VFLTYLFNLHNFNIYRLLAKNGVIYWLKKISIQKDNTLTADKVLIILVDVNEQPTPPTQSPTEKQKKSYSGKKSARLLKRRLLYKRMEGYL
jgi:hypothetical protein